MSLAQLSGWDQDGPKVRKMIEACNTKYNAMRKGKVISTGPLAPGAGKAVRATIVWQEKDIRMKGDNVLLQAKDFTEGWKEVKALHPTLTIVPRPGGRGNVTERTSQCTEEDGKTLLFKITKDHEDDFFLILGRPTQELLPEEGGSNWRSRMMMRRRIRMRPSRRRAMLWRRRRSTRVVVRGPGRSPRLRRSHHLPRAPRRAPRRREPQEELQGEELQGGKGEIGVY